MAHISVRLTVSALALAAVSVAVVMHPSPPPVSAQTSPSNKSTKPLTPQPTRFDADLDFRAPQETKLWNFKRHSLCRLGLLTAERYSFGPGFSRIRLVASLSRLVMESSNPFLRGDIHALPEISPPHIQVGGSQRNMSIRMAMNLALPTVKAARLCLWSRGIDCEFGFSSAARNGFNRFSMLAPTKR